MYRKQKIYIEKIAGEEIQLPTISIFNKSPLPLQITFLWFFLCFSWGDPEKFWALFFQLQICLNSSYPIQLPIMPADRQLQYSMRIQQWQQVQSTEMAQRRLLRGETLSLEGWYTSITIHQVNHHWFISLPLKPTHL